MASTVPIAGSAYTYAYATMGEFIAWLIGWDLILEYMVGATTVAIGWSGYVTSVLHDWRIHIPAQFTQSPGTKLIEIPNEIADKLHMRHGWSILGSVEELLSKNQIDFSAFPQVTAIFNVPAMFIVALVTALLVVGIQESARVNNVIVADQGDDRRPLHPDRSAAGDHRPTGAGRSSPIAMDPGSTSSTAGAASSAEPAWFSSPTSASTRSRRPPRRPRIPSATCRSGSSARWRSARSSTVWPGSS